MQTDQPLVLSEVWPRAFSVALVVIGFGVVALTLHDLGNALWPINILTPFFAVIVGGAVMVGLAFAAGGMQPRARHWTLHDDRIEVDLQPLLGPSRRFVVRPGDVARARIVELDWESREMTWSIEVELAGGRRIGTPEIGTRARAESVLARINAFAAS
jgi:hypothetical protein